MPHPQHLAREPVRRGEVSGPIFSERELHATPEDHSSDLVINAYLVTHARDAGRCPDERCYFQVGRQYRVIFGGGDAGSLTVQKYEADMCGNLLAEVTAQTSALLGGEVRALAVSSDRIGGGEGSRRAPNEEGWGRMSKQGGNHIVMYALFE